MAGSRLLREFSLQDRVFAVTGAAQGLGLVLATALIESGARVVALDLQPEKNRAVEFNIAAEKARELGSSLEYRQLDVTDTAKLNNTFDGISNDYGRLDGLIAAAGIQHEEPLLDVSIEDFRKVVEVNLNGVFSTAQAAAKTIIKGKKSGSIVLIGSMSGSIANRGLLCAGYNSSKAGVLQLTRGLAAELGEYNIRVNSISPGYIMTKMVTELFETYPERGTEWASQNMLGRLSQPEEYRGIAVFLSSDASSFATGSNFIIDGGHTAW